MGTSSLKRSFAHLVLLAAAGCAGGSSDLDDLDLAAQSQAAGAAPVNQLPSPQTTNEDSPLFFSVVGGNALSVSDADNANLTVQIIVTNGTFTLGRTTGLSVTGNGTFSVTASGTIEALNNGLDGARYEPAEDYSGPSTLQMNTSDSNGESDLDVLGVTVTAFNDPPVNGAPTGSQAATEDVPRSFTLSISDVDVGSGPVVVSLTASNATSITLAAIAGLSFTSGDGASDTAMTFSGTLPDVNAALNGLVVTPPLNYIGASTLQITSNDQGASGAGVPGSDNDTVNIAWAAVNDAPVNAVPAPQVVTEDTSLTFDAGNALGVGDVDASTALIQVQLTASSGTVTLGSPGSVAFTTGDGTADSTMTFTGTLSALNAALANTTYTPSANFAGTATVTMVSSDLGNSGSGGPKQDSDAVTITVGGVNDAPVNGVPGAQLTNEDIARVFSASNGNAITVADADATSLQVTVAATTGVITLGSKTGLTFQSGDGTADPSMTFTGTTASINTALNGATYVPPANANGAATVTVTTSDLGATGTGGTLTDEDSIAITIAAVNDAPTAVNDTLAVAEDAGATAVAVLGNDTFAPDVGETLSVSAVGTPLHGDATTDGTTVTYTPDVDYNGPDSFTYTLSDGAGGTATATVSVTIASVNDAPAANDDSFSVVANSTGNNFAVLSNDGIAPDTGEMLGITAAGAPAHGSTTVVSGGTRIAYTPAADYSGDDSFTYTVSDGNGGVDTATVYVTVTAVITEPVNTLPGPQTIVEDTPLFFSAAAGNALSVSDANNTTLTVQVLAQHGTFTLGSTSGVTHSGNGGATVTVSGTIASLNNALDDAKYTPAQNYNGAAQLTINSSDSNGESDLDVLTLSVTSFNDAPVNHVPTTTQGASEDSPETFSTISISDVDLSGANIEVSLTADNGTVISLASISGLVFAEGDGTADTTMTFTGALARVNTALNGMTITSPANYIGPSTLVIASSDLGSTGAGVVGQDTDTINLNWSATNDAPVNTTPGVQQTLEEEPVVFSSTLGTALSVSDQDVSAGTMQVQLMATNGTLTLGTPGGVTFTTGDGVADTSMTFRGTIAEVNGALEGTAYTPNVNVVGTATVTMISNDQGNTGGSAKSDNDPISILIGAVNDAPVLSVPPPLMTNEDVTRVFATAQGNPVTVDDVDATALQVSLTASEATMTLGGKSGLTFQAGDGTGDATMTFTGTRTAINNAMNNMQFIPTPNFIGTASFTITATDLGATGAGGPMADEETVYVTVMPVNDAPEAVNDTVAATEDSAGVEVEVLANDGTGPDVGEALVVSAVSTPGHGAATISPDGARVVYTPAADYAGADSFTYTVSDGNGGLDTATVAVTVANVNDPPTAADDTFTVTENSTANTLAVRTNDSAAPDSGETLTVSVVGAPGHGTASVTGGTTISYTPTAGYSGTDTFTYTLADPSGAVDTALVTVTISSVDTQPIAADDAVTVAEDAFATVTVLGNDTGLGDAPLTITITGAAAHGTAVASDSSVVYTPAANYHGADSFAYTVTDSDGDTDAGTVAVTVTSVDDVPVAAADSAALDEDADVDVAVLGNDGALGDGPVIVTVTAAPEHGTTAVASGVVTYTPAADYHGDDTFTYRLVDADGDVATAAVTLTVASINDAPEVIDDIVSTRTGEVVVADVLGNDHDVDGDALTITVVTTPLHGAAVAADGAITYTPAAGYVGADAFDYTVTDGTVSTTGTVTVGVGTDRDGDGLIDIDELQVHGTDPDLADTDGDELDDGVEVATTGTAPADDDSDDDGVLDGREDADADGVVDAGETSATDADSDADGLQDGTELGFAAGEGEDTAGTFAPDLDPASTTDPRVADTDGGGKADGDEDANHNGRVDGDETDPTDAGDDVPDDGGGGGGGGGGGAGGGGGGGCNAGGGASGLAFIGLLLAALALQCGRDRSRRAVARDQSRRP